MKPSMNGTPPSPSLVAGGIVLGGLAIAILLAVMTWVLAPLVPPALVVVTTGVLALVWLVARWRDTESCGDAARHPRSARPGHLPGR